MDVAGARALLADQGLDPPAQVLAELVELCEGDPLVLGETTQRLGAHQLSGRVPLPRRPFLGPRALAAHSEPWQALPAATKSWLLLLALGHDSALPVCVRAGRALGLTLDDLEPAERRGVVHAYGTSRIHWHSPLARDAVRQSATLGETTRTATALAEATDPEDTARHAWYLAESLTDSDRAANSLVEAAVPLSRHGALLDAYEALDRAGALTTDSGARELYRILRAEIAWLAGYGEHALDLLEAGTCRGADAETSSVIMRAVMHGFDSSWSAAWSLLPKDAPSPLNPHHATRLLVTALTAGWDSVAPQTLRELLVELREVPDETVRGLVDALDSVLSGHSDAEDRRVLRSLAWWLEPSDPLHPKAWPPPLLPVFLNAEDDYAQLFSRLLRSDHVRAAHSTRALLLLKLATAQSALGHWYHAVDNAIEGARLAAELGHEALRSESVLLLGWIAAARGDEREAHEHLDTAARHEGRDASRVQPWMMQWARGLAALGNGRPTEAFERLQGLHTGPATTPRHFAIRRMATADTVEAAVQAQRGDEVTALVADFAEWVEHGAAAWARLDLARCRAALTDDAEQWYREALERGVEAGRLLSIARTELNFGTWLRHHKRNREARAHLRTAEEHFDRLGAVVWRQRAHAELRATGETGTGEACPQDELTPQERRIARLAAQGLTNRQIAHRLSLSPRTIGYHLYKTFPKLDITSRTQLAALFGNGEE